MLLGNLNKQSTKGPNNSCALASTLTSRNPRADIIRDGLSIDVVCVTNRHITANVILQNRCSFVVQKVLDIGNWGLYLANGTTSEQRMGEKWKSDSWQH
jgi:hypothetical protein